MDKKALIIGATSSLAVSMAGQLARRNYNLCLAGRDEYELEIISQDLRIRYNVEIAVMKIDLAFINFSAAEFMRDLGEKFSNFDSVFMLAGDMGEQISNDERNIENVIKINYLQPAKILQLIAEKMAINKKGRIVIISSVAGDRGRQSNYIYGSAKAALSAFASGLRNKFFRYNVHVMTVKPGFLDTPMTYGMRSPLIWPREKAAKSIIKAMLHKKDVVYIPFFWRYIMLIITHIPEKIFKRISL